MTPPFSASDAASRRPWSVIVLRSGALPAVGVAIVALLWLLVTHGPAPILRADAATVDRLHGYAMDHPRWVTVQKAISYGGTLIVYQLVIVLLALPLVRAREWRLPLAALVVLDVSSALNDLAKALASQSLAAGDKSPIDFALAENTGPLTLHPGAQRFYDEHRAGAASRN